MKIPSDEIYDVIECVDEEDEEDDEVDPGKNMALTRLM